MAFGYLRVLEIVVRRPRHSEALHHALRAPIRGYGHRDDFLEPQTLERKPNRRLSRLGRIAASPVFAREPPADFDAGSEMRLELGDAQPHESDEIAHAHDLDCPQ